MKILIVGFGKMGMLHAATLNQLPGVTMITVCDPSEMVLAGLTRFAPHIQLYKELPEALKKNRYDAAVIASPTQYHAEAIELCLQEKIHLFIEKPFVSDLHSAEKIKALSGQNPEIKITVGHCLRYVPTFAKAHKLISQGVFGKIRSAYSTMFSPDVQRKVKGWRFGKNRSGGGVLLDLGSHLVDMNLFLLGAPLQVSAVTRSVFSEFVADECEAEWIHETFRSRLEISWSRPDVRKATLTFKAEGENGTLSVTDDELSYEVISDHNCAASGVYKENLTGLESAVPFDLAGPFYTRQLTAWLDSIDKNLPAPNSIDLNIVNLKLLNLMESSDGKRLESGCADQVDGVMHG